MRWCRSSQRFGGCMALFALWLQFTVSFAHIHPKDFISPSDTALLGFVSSAQFSTKGPTSRAMLSSGDHGNRLPQDECAICASIYLISSALIGQPPALTVPVFFNSVFLPSIGEFDFQIARYFSFRTRAPPVA
jgi:hypothetical protein